MRSQLKKLFLGGLLAASLLPATAHADAGFQRWIKDFKSVAAGQGIQGRIYDEAFRGVTAPDPVVLEKARFQPEFKAENWTYFDNRVNEGSVSEGRAMLKKWGRWLNAIEQKLGVDKHIILAIWSMETNYGAVMDRDDVMKPIMRSLATLAYQDKRRAKFARSQMIAAMKIVQSGDATFDHMRGSWAGAVGHTQFIPTSLLAYKYDADGDNKVDIWESIPDALATAANLLRKNGWDTGETWGYEVNLPTGRKFPGGRMSLAKWQSIGVTRTNGKAFPRPGDNAELKVLDGRAGPAFLVLDNFRTIKRYNNADKYALSVGLLADQIAGFGAPSRDWDRPFTKLTFDETMELQQRLLKRGFYDGKIDGKIGSGSRGAIQSFQASIGMAQDGHPSREVLMKLR